MKVRKLLTDLSNLMEMDEMEKALQDKMRYCVLKIAKAKAVKGKPDYDKAEDLVTKVYLRKIQTPTGLLDIVSRLCVLAGVYLTDNEIEYLKQMHPIRARALLTLGALKHREQNDKEVSKDTPEEMASCGEQDTQAFDEGEAENE